MRKLGLVLFFAVMATGVQHAFGIQQFQNAFMDKYIKDHKDKEFSKYVSEKVKCFVCHQGKSRKNRNAYGAQLAELLDKKTDSKNVKKINEALDKVAKMHSDPKDKKSPTFGELIAKGELPGGKLDDLKKEPKEEKKE
jgi:hypothetical protein